MTARLLLCCLIASFGAAQTLAAEGLEDKLQELLTRHMHGAETAKDFEIAEDEANVYLRKQSTGELPEGIESPWVRFEDSLAVVGATLDLDKLEGELSDSVVLKLLSGRVPVEVTTRIVAAAGVGKLVLEKVLLAGVELPPDMVASLIPEDQTGSFLPPGFRLGEAFTLPFNLESIRCQPGSVLVRQRAAEPLLR